MKITISNTAIRRFENALRDGVIKVVADSVLPQINNRLVSLSLELASDIVDSAEWRSLKSSKMIAEFGFAPWEVDDLDEITKYLIPGAGDKEITNIERKYSRTGAPRVVLHWVDFPKLLWNPFSQHELTRRASRSARRGGQSIGGFTRGQVVSWLDWFENGVTIPGFDVEYPLSDPRAKFFSRSGLGLMKPEDGGFWSFQGTQLFTNIERGFVNKYGKTFQKDAKNISTKQFKKVFKGRRRR